MSAAESDVETISVYSDDARSVSSSCSCFHRSLVSSSPGCVAYCIALNFRRQRGHAVVETESHRQTEIEPVNRTAQNSTVSSNTHHQLAFLVIERRAHPPTRIIIMIRRHILTLLLVVLVPVVLRQTCPGPRFVLLPTSIIHIHTLCCAVQLMLRLRLRLWWWWWWQRGLPLS